MLNATGLAIFLLVQGTFAAGAHSLSWQTCIFGGLAFAVPAIAWIEESALILVLAAADFISLASAFWWLGHRKTAARKL